MPQCKIWNQKILQQMLLLLLLEQMKTHGNAYSNPNIYVEHEYTIRFRF